MAISQAHDGTGFKQDVSRFGEGVGALKTDVNNLAHSAVDTAKSGAAEIRRGAHNAVEFTKDKLDHAKDSASEATESFRGIVQRNPIAGVSIAVGVGLLLGMIFVRARR